MLDEIIKKDNINVILTNQINIIQELENKMVKLLFDNFKTDLTIKSKRKNNEIIKNIEEYLKNNNMKLKYTNVSLEIQPFFK